MSDTVERLREEGSFPPYYGVPAIQRDAADEIERLRAALELLSCYGYGPRMWFQKQWLTPQEVARAALSPSKSDVTSKTERDSD